MISLLFVSGNDIGSRLIKWFSHGADFSHVDVIWPDGKLFGSRTDRSGAPAAGVQFRDASYVNGCETLRIDIPAVEADRQRFYDFLLAQEGKPYDASAIAAFIFGRDWQEDDSWFCSELVTSALVQGGVFKYPLVVPSNKITPSDLLLLLSAVEPIGVRPSTPPG